MTLETDPRLNSVCIIGAGTAGLITGHTLLQDGFRNIQIVTRDSSPGGVWAEERVYPGLYINNVHGEFRFSSLPMKLPQNAAELGGRLSGNDLRDYMKTFSETFLKDKIRFNTEVDKIQRDGTGTWLVSVTNKSDGSHDILKFDKIVLCTGGCSTPKYEPRLSPAAAELAQFKGLVVHAMDFEPKLETILHSAAPIQPGSEDEAPCVVIIGCGKSAQDMSAYLANEGRKVSVVFETADAFFAGPKPLPDFIRKSSNVASHGVADATRFLHTTWLGMKIVQGTWDGIERDAFKAFSVPDDSPLRNARSPFWSVRTNDEGVPRSNSFHSLVNMGKIELIAPARVVAYGTDGHSVVLSTGKTIKADVLIHATGYESSWTNLFEEKTAEDIGIHKHPVEPTKTSNDEWEYTTLVNPPPTHPENEQWATSLYRGIVPAKNIDRHDFAANGAVLTTNTGYTCEVTAHWISSYFLQDKMQLPSPEKAFEESERAAAWIRKRYPDACVNESASGLIAFFTWPQYTDELLEDMGLRTMRSGGNWLTWPFKIIDLNEISTLGEERSALRIN